MLIGSSESHSIDHVGGGGLAGDRGLMGARQLPFTAIPTIDIAPLFGKDWSQFVATAQEIGAAARNVGFFYIRNHGIALELIERTYEHSRQFHNSPAELKKRVSVDNSPGNRGWTPTSLDEDDPDKELYRLVEAKDPDDDYLTNPRLHAAFDLSLDIPDNDPDFLAGNIMLVPNQWPDWLPNFRAEVMEYYNAVAALGERLFRAFAVSLDLPEEFFISRARKPPSQLRLLHYPENDLPITKRNLGIGAHSDFECFTILHQQAPGLQVMNTANEWVEAPPIEGTFIVNIGDLLEGWTNGLFKATQHRVVNIGKERYSMPLFFAADYHTRVEPLPQFVTPEQPAKYNSIVAGEHLAGFSINSCKHLRKRVLSGDLRITFPIHDENPFKRRAVNEYQDTGTATAAG